MEQEGFRHLPSEVVGCRHDGHGTDAASEILSKTGVAAVQISPAMLRAAAKVRSKVTFLELEICFTPAVPSLGHFISRSFALLGSDTDQSIS